MTTPVLPWAEGHDGHLRVGEGWWPLVIELADTLNAAHPGYKFSGVYEKDGQLRAHIVMPGGMTVPDSAYAAIWDAQVKSARVCEQCGPGCHRHHTETEEDK
ncbi:MAG: hypothetical protein P8099_20550 [Gemmatimonadota bacterium]